MKTRWQWCVILLAAVMLGCGEEELEDHACPPNNTLTYDNFGRQFFDSYCVRCHGDANAYSSRAFVTLDSIQKQADRIFINAAANNTAMPPGPNDPTASERAKLADWLACGAP